MEQERVVAARGDRVESRRFDTAFHNNLYPGLGMSRGVFFTREDFGVDKLVTGDLTYMVADDIAEPTECSGVRGLHWRVPPAGELPRAAPRATREHARCALGQEPRAKAGAPRSHQLSRFHSEDWGLDRAAANTFQKRSSDFFAIGIDGVPAADAALVGYPGFGGLGSPSNEEAQRELEEPYRYHFPDGNASIARLLLRRLIPALAPGTTMDDVVTAHFDYAKLDWRGRPFVSASPARW